MSPSNPRSPAPQRKRLPPFAYILIGLFMYAAGAFLFFYFSDLERSGERVSIHAAVALLYKLGGKWLVAGVCALIGTGCLIGGIVGFVRSLL